MSDPAKSQDNYSVKQLQTAKASVIQILSDLDSASSQWASEAVPAVYTIAVEEARGDLGASVSGQFGTVHRQAAQILAETSYSRIADVLTLAGRQVTDIWRQVQLGRNLAGGALGYETWRQTRDKLQQSLRDGGITAFVDRSGKKWNLKSYASMLSRTELMNVHNEAKRTEFMEHGEDLVIVSSHPGTCEKCAPWQGRVLSLSGKTSGYPTLDQAKEAGLFHPNCRHSYSLYIPDEGETAADTHVKESAWRAEADAEDVAWREAEEEKRREKEEAKRWKINREKQNRHMEGTKEYREYAKKLEKEGLVPSCLTITSKELRRIIEEREGEWEPLPSSGKSGEKWCVKLNRPVGKWYDKNGQGPFESDVIIVAPSKTGVHCYPGNPSEGR